MKNENVYLQLTTRKRKQFKSPKKNYVNSLNKKKVEEKKRSSIIGRKKKQIIHNNSIFFLGTISKYQMAQVNKL